MSRLFLTGGSGFLGRRLIPRLIAQGHTVRALTRTSQARSTVAALGGEPVDGDVSDLAAIERGMLDCSAVVHVAGKIGLSGPYRDFHHVNVVGTGNVIAAARRSASVKRLVYIGAAASIMGEARVRNADESWPLQRLSYSPYPATKSLADEAVRAANGPSLSTCVLRPGWIWGPDDPILQSMVDATRAGRMRLIDGGTHRIVTSHVDNVCHSIGLALDHAEGGEAYFVFDDAGIALRDWVGQLLATQGLELPNKRIPYRVAWSAACVLEFVWRVFRREGAPPIVRALVRLQGREFTVSDRKARATLGYLPVVSREVGLAELSSSNRQRPS